MINNWKAKAGVAALIVVCGGIACAQTNGPIGLSARVGAFFPTDTAAHDLGSTWLGLGLDYKLNTLTSQLGGGALGYFGISGDYYSHGGDSNVPIVLNYNYRQGQLVFSAGAGVDFYNIPDIGSKSGTGFDLQGAVSYDLSTGTALPIFLQAKYFLAGRSELRGFGLYVGARF